MLTNKQLVIAGAWKLHERRIPSLLLALCILSSIFHPSIPLSPLPSSSSTDFQSRIYCLEVIFISSFPLSILISFLPWWHKGRKRDGRRRRIVIGSEVKSSRGKIILALRPKAHLLASYNFFLCLFLAEICFLFLCVTPVHGGWCKDVLCRNLKWNEKKRRFLSCQQTTFHSFRSCECDTRSSHIVFYKLLKTLTGCNFWGVGCRHRINATLQFWRQRQSIVNLYM